MHLEHKSCPLVGQTSTSPVAEEKRGHELSIIVPEGVRNRFYVLWEMFKIFDLVLAATALFSSILEESSWWDLGQELAASFPKEYSEQCSELVSLLLFF